MPNVVLIDPQGNAHEVTEEQAADAISIGGWRLQTADDQRGRANEAALEETYGGARGTIGGAGAGALDAVTLGGFSAGVRALGGREDLAALKERNAEAYLGGNIAGSVLPGGLAARAGQLAVGRVGTTAVSRIAAAARGQAVEGLVEGVGQGIAELATSEDPLTLGRAASVIGSNALYGGATGGLVGGAAKAVGEGLGAARQALEGVAARGSAQSSAAAGLPDDLSALDAKALRAARRAELEALGAAQGSQRAALKGEIAAEEALAETELVARRSNLRADIESELSSIEQTRVAERASLADEIGAHRRSTREEKIFLTTKGAEESDLRVLGKRTLKADRQLDALLDNPKNLAQRPERALAALQQQESALEAIVARRESLLQRFAGDTSGERAAALDATEAALQRNRSLQARIGELSGKPTSTKLEALKGDLDALPTRSRSAKLVDLQNQLDGTIGAPKSPRLEAIDRAIEALPEGGQRGIAEQALAGGAYSLASSAAAAIPFVGPILAPLVGARAASAATSLVFGKVGAAVSEATTRAATAAAKFAGVAEKLAAAPASAQVASRVLQELTYAPVTGAIERNEDARERRQGKARARADGESRALAAAFRARAREIRSQVESDGAGGYRMRQSAREEMAARLLPIRVASPLMADRIETHAARRISYLASKLPRKPEMSTLPHGPDTWAPSDIEIRSFARTAAAVEDPHGVFERLADGKITPEEAEAVNAVHPELSAAQTEAIMMGLTKGKKKLSYRKRLAFSVFTGQPIEAAMAPQVFALLQANFALEPGTEGGTQAPTPQPQFGSVKAEDPLKTQERK